MKQLAIINMDKDNIRKTYPLNIIEINERQTQLLNLFVLLDSVIFIGVIYSHNFHAVQKIILICSRMILNGHKF